MSNPEETLITSDFDVAIMLRKLRTEVKYIF